MATKEFTGKNVQDAIKNGLEAMGLGIDEADIDIVSEGGGGLFGIGAKKAVVRISPIDDDDIDVSYSVSEPEDTFSDKLDNFKAKAGEFAEAAVEMGGEFARKAGAGAAVLAEDVKHKAEDVKARVDERGGFARVVREKARDFKENIEDLADRTEEKLEDFGERIEARLEQDAYENTDSTEHIKFLSGFLDGLFERMNISCTYDITQKGDTLTVNISSNESGKLIGHRGETLDAIQYITRLAIHKQDLPYRSVIVQTENYREKREQTLKSLAKRLEAKVERTGRKVTLEPMKPYERRIIHETLQSSQTVSTDSYGEEPNRYVVIIPKKK